MRAIVNTISEISEVKWLAVLGNYIADWGLKISAKCSLGQLWGEVWPLPAVTIENSLGKFSEIS